MPLSDVQRLTDLASQPRALQLWKTLQSLRSCVSFMNTGAHPDDETSAMLAALGLRDGVKLSHACSTRGEGGQNAIGVETGADLGTIRTREMERAAAVLNMTQYWLSDSPSDTITDFGFSKSGTETLGKWGEQRTLERFVYIVRLERPDIVCPTFLDIPGQHGHHRAMTATAFRAVKKAADPDEFAHQGLAPWQVQKLYLPAWSGAGDAYDDDVPPPPRTTRVDGTGGVPVLGADYAQIGQISRSFHKTQQMGRWIETGTPNVTPLFLAWTPPGFEIAATSEEPDIFAGLPRTLRELAGFAAAPELNEPLSETQNLFDRMVRAWPDRKEISRLGVQSIQMLEQVMDGCPSGAMDQIMHRLETKKRAIGKILFLSSSISARAFSGKAQARPGETVELGVHLHGPDKPIRTEFVVPDGWHAGPVRQQKNGTLTTDLTVGENAGITNPYPHRWFPDRVNSLPFVRVHWQEHGVKLSHDVELEQRLNILPPVTLDMSPDTALLNVRAPSELMLSMNNINAAGQTIDLTGPQGWSARKTKEKTGFDTPGQQHWRITPPKNLKEGLYRFDASTRSNPAYSVRHMDFSHTGPLVRAVPARFQVRALEIELPKVRIAYIGGGSDRVDHWLSQLGLDITTLDDEELARTDFSAYDSVLAGIFAFRTRSLLAGKLATLHHWVREGGNLVTLYHRPWDNWDPKKTALAPLHIGKPSLRWRVTDENAPVNVLDPDHPLLSFPNRIGDTDWAGWTKERGLYFASCWDKAYQPLLSMADPGEPALDGALLTGRFGHGRHTHTSLVLHYQLEHLVPGAYRLLANFLAPLQTVST